MKLITGASSGLGAALARHYHAEGASLLLTGRSEQRLQQLAAELPGVSCQATDLTNPQAIEALLDTLGEAPEMLLHCAGSGRFGNLETQSPVEIKTLIDNNLLSTLLLLRAMLARWRQESMTLVIVMSTAALQPKAGESSYCAVKWAVRGMLESLRLELKGSKIKLIAVYPGGMATGFWPSSGKLVDTSSFMTADEAAAMLSQALQSYAHGYVSDITLTRG
ncbi:SDR family NAD(P)-dependent oxidoreductase [Shewanella algae]|uniref:SDR family NAD(P)-dependent oxidoreductase n=1 Tax=Shewanella algae TaxID=38313 RepID=UPI0031F51272